MTAPRRFIKDAPFSERLSGQELIRQAIHRRSLEDQDLRTAILDPAAAGDVYGQHKPAKTFGPMAPGYQQTFHSGA